MINFKQFIREDLEPADFEARKALRSKEYDAAHEIHTNLVKHYSHFTPEHKTSIKDYTYNSKALNGFHWNNHNKTSDAYSKEPLYIERMKRETKDMDSVINAHETPHELNVYSNSRHDPRELKNSKAIVHHPAYLSATLSRHVAKGIVWNAKKDKETGELHHHIMKIHVSEGHAGAYVDHHSQLSSQKEFILPRGLNMKYHKTESQKFGNDNYHYHHMSIEE
jgi:hypothetical protein